MNCVSGYQYLAKIIAIMGIVFAAQFGGADEIKGRFAPPEGKTLVFAGGNNAAVGGTAKYRDGYVDNVGVPGGISQIIRSGRGLNTEADWGKGPMHQKAYLDSPTLDRCVIHLSVPLEHNLIARFLGDLVSLVEAHQEHPFLINLGPDFDVPESDYEPEAFTQSFRRIVDAFREKKLPNFAIVFSSSADVKPGQFEKYNPGADYYDWIGYSWKGGGKDGRPAVDFARKLKKPAFITQATVGERFANEVDDEVIWRSWFEPFFAHIEENKDVVRAVSYINSDYPVEAAPRLLHKWRDRMNQPGFINSVDKPFAHIGFPAPYAEPEKVEFTYFPYKDSTLPIAQRIDDLLGRMSLEEKAAQMTGWWHRDERKLRQEGEIFTKEFYASVAPHGIGHLGPINLNCEEDIRQHNAVQEYFVRNTRLGIPALRYSEAAHGLTSLDATSFPVPIALACSWNPSLMEKVYSHVGQEARSRGVFQVLSPNINVIRDPRWGRIDETLGEDPFLTGRLGAAMVNGLQGSSDGSVSSNHVAATLKHFAGFGANEGGRSNGPYVDGRRQLLDREISPFQHIIKNARPAAVMPALNEIDGTPCHINSWLLRDVLRKRLEYEGLVITDSDAIQSIRESHKIGVDDAAVAMLALKAGIQTELPNPFGYQHLVQLVNEQKLEQSELDGAVRSILDLKFRLGLFEEPWLEVEKAESLIASLETKELALEAARQSIVLLKNEREILPLDINRKHTIAVIGPNSDVCRLGSYSGTPSESVSLLQGIENYVGETAEVVHAKGCIFALNDTEDSYQNWRHVNNVNFAGLDLNRPLIDEAIAVANQADVVILSLGENMFLARDRTGLDLTESQQVLAQEVLATGKPVILYLMHGRPITLGDLADDFKAILTGHYAGQETGTAAAEIIFGETNPSGKLTISWPQLVGQLPVYYNRQRSSNLSAYLDSERAAVYPFGYGLSYTSFSYGPPMLSSATIQEGESVDVVVEVTNTGARAGSEIVQVYVSGEKFPIARPGLELKGFARVTLDPGETRKVKIEIDADDLHFHNANWERGLPAGAYQVRVGGSSEKLSRPLTLETGSKQIAPPPIEVTETTMVPDEEDNENGDSVIRIDTSDSLIRQTIDGFGGLIAFLESVPPDDALEAVINGLNLNLIRAQGEVSPSGDPLHNREVLRRAMKLNPDLQVLLTFWQPKSAIYPRNDYWLNEVTLDDDSFYALKPERENEWASEIVHRVNLYRDWGVNVSVISVQNKSDLSRLGTQSCRWEPDRLAEFIERKVRPGLNAAGLNEVKIAAPDLSYLGKKAFVVDQYIPALTSPAVDIAAYHMYADSVEQAADLTPLIRDTRAMQGMRFQHFPEKKIWMTETIGSPGSADHDAAIKTARYLHTAMVDGEASAFLWRNLIESRRDEGLVYLAGSTNMERTKKYYAFRQFSAFVKPGFNRLEVSAPESIDICAFISPDKKRVVCVAINDGEDLLEVKFQAPEDMKLIGTFQTDRDKNYSPVDPTSGLPAKSVRTFVYSK